MTLSGQQAAQSTQVNSEKGKTFQMDTSKLNDVVQTLANLGVIAGIIFLAIEVRQTTLATQSATRQAISESIENRTLTLATSPDLLHLIDRSAKSDEIQQGSIEDFQLEMFYASVLTAAEESFLQMSDGNLNKDFYEARAMRALVVFQTEHALDYIKWAGENGKTMTPAFKSWLDEALGDKSPFEDH